MDTTQDTPGTLLTTDEAEDLAQAILDAADSGGIIQAQDMVDLASDPRMHTACRMWDVADYHGPKVHAALAGILEYDPAD